jgi:hydrogenase maturation protease
MTGSARGTRTIQGHLQEHKITVIIGETDVPYCLNEIRPDDFLIIIDAVMQGNEPGSVVVFPLRDAVTSRGKLRSRMISA